MDSTLTRYVLGDLPPKDMEALDERSIVDADFAEQVRAAEHDLADTYARGELSADDRARWERGPGASQAGQQQVRIARALQRREAAPRPVPSRTATFTPRWALAAAAIIAVFAGGAYVLRHQRAADPPAVSADGTPAVAPPSSVPAPAAASFVAVTLPIPTRSPSEPPVLVIPAATQQARITFRLEPSEFTTFSVALVDPGTRRVVWRAENLPAESGADGRTLTAQLPAAVLRAGRAIFQIMGVTGSGSELVGMYPLTVHRKT